MKKQSHEVEGTAANSAALKVLKSTVASIILKWKKFGTSWILPRASSGKLSNLGRRALVREGTQWSTLAEFQRSCVDDGETSRRTIINATVH